MNHRSTALTTTYSYDIDEWKAAERIMSQAWVEQPRVV